MPERPPDAEYFPSPEAFRAWLDEHHADRDELWVGFHRVSSGTPSLTWREAVDEALCFGWIDGVRKGVDETRHVIRFTPRRPRSIWSAVNIARVEALEAEGRIREPGRAAFARREEERSRVYSHERADAHLDPAMVARFQADADAWAFWTAQPPGYRRTLSWWVISGKRPETQAKRLDELMRESAAGRRVGQFERPMRKPATG